MEGLQGGSVEEQGGRQWVNLRRHDAHLRGNDFTDGRVGGGITALSSQNFTIQVWNGIDKRIKFLLKN